MFVNNMPFLMIIIKRLKFTTIEYIPNRSDKELARPVNKILDIY